MPHHVAVNPSSAGPSRLYLERAFRGLRQADVEERTGIPRSRLSQIERGLVWPRDGEIQKLAEVFERTFLEVADMARAARAEVGQVEGGQADA